MFENSCFKCHFFVKKSFFYVLMIEILLAPKNVY